MKKKSKAKLLLRESQKDRVNGAVPAVTLDLTKISFSSISTYLRCAKQYWWRYIQGVIEPPKIVFIEGKANHSALEMNNKHKRDRGFDMKPAVVTEKFVEELRAQTGAVEDLDWKEESEDGLIERGTIWHKGYLKDYAPGITPDIIEESFEKEVELGGRSVLVRGVIDLGYSKKVSDYKTISAYGFNSRKKSIDHDLQMTLYSWATGRKLVENICFVKKNVPEVGILSSTRTQKDVDWALKVAGEVVNGIAQGVFPMTDPANWVCDPKWCGYHSICRGAK